MLPLPLLHPLLPLPQLPSFNGHTLLPPCCPPCCPIPTAPFIATFLVCHPSLRSLFMPCLTSAAPFLDPLPPPSGTSA